ncbi:MAG: ABC transporter ATP-binding protein [Candidatus Njordarchaeales archaeon]
MRRLIFIIWCIIIGLGEIISATLEPVSFTVMYNQYASLFLFIMILFSLIAYITWKKIILVEFLSYMITLLATASLVLGFFIYMEPIQMLSAIGYAVLSITLALTLNVDRVGARNRVERKSEMPNKDSEYVVEVIDVKKDYIVGPIVVHALRGLTMKIRRGEFVAIMGPSGSGKSTLLNLIGALDRPTAGKIIIDGVDISTLTEDELAEFRNKKIGFIFQQFNLITRTTVLRNVELPAIVAGIPPKERRKRALELLKLVGLTEKEAMRRPVYLSGGQQQRVAIVRALMNNPSIILADEPTGNLDSKTGAEIVRILRELNEKFGTTIIVVTHDKDVAKAADRILYIRDGVIVGEEILRREKYEN